jgi:transposase
MDAKATYKELKQSYAQDLEGQTVSLKEAAERYQIATGTLSGWIDNGLIQVIEPAKRRGMPNKLNLRDVAIMVELNRLYRAESNTRGPLKGWNKDQE